LWPQLIREEIEENAEPKKKVEEKPKLTIEAKEAISSTATNQSSTPDNQSASRLVGTPGPGDILPPSNDTGPAPTPPKDLNDTAIKRDDLLAVVNPLVTDLVPTTNGPVTVPSPDKESQKALSVAELIALTDLLNDSAVSDFSFLSYVSPSSLVHCSNLWAGLTSVRRLRWREKRWSWLLCKRSSELWNMKLNWNWIRFKIKMKILPIRRMTLVCETLDNDLTALLSLHPTPLLLLSLDDSAESDTDADDPSIRRLRSVLKGMMKKLEVRVKQTEDQLGKKLQQLDKDRDGILDSNELREAVMKILKKKDLSAEETQNFIQLLDQDNDGKGMSAPPDVVSPYLTLSLSPR
jgi:hypothetical protein